MGETARTQVTEQQNKAASPTTQEPPPARRIVRLEVEYVRSATVEFDFPDSNGMGEAGWGEHAVGVMLRQMWTQAYGKRASMDETVNFKRWRTVSVCDPDHQGYEYEHADWEPVPPFESVVRCSRCGVEHGK